MLPPWCHH